MSRGLIVKPALNQKRVILSCRCEWKLNNHELTRMPSRGECRMRSLYCDERSYTIYTPLERVYIDALFILLRHLYLPKTPVVLRNEECALKIRTSRVR